MNSNSFYNHGNFPSFGAPLTSPALSSEFDKISNAFNLFPSIAGNGSKVYRVNSTGTAVEAVDATTAFPQVQTSSTTYLTSVTGTDTITATATPPLTAYATGSTFRFESSGINTGASTLNIDALGPISILRPDGTALLAGDIPVIGYICEVHKRAADFVLVNAATYNAYKVSAAASAATATAQAVIAAIQAGTATTQADISTTQAINATVSAAEAAASAASLHGTSTTSLLIAVANKVFTTQANEAYTAGVWITATSAANIANWMYGQVVSYSGATLTVDVQVVGGSGTYADWNLNISAARGVTGPAGFGLIPQAVGFTATAGTTPHTLTVDADAAISTLNAKQDALVAGTNIKTVNGGSLLGAGDVAVVDTATAQTIGGVKTFTSSPAIPVAMLTGQAIPLGQAEGRYVLSGADSSTNNIKQVAGAVTLTIADSGKEIRCTATATIALPLNNFGASYRIYPYALPTTLTSSTGMFYFPDGTTAAFTYVLPVTGYGSYYEVSSLDGTNWLVRAWGRTIISPAVAANEAVAHGQAFGLSQTMKNYPMISGAIYTNSTSKAWFWTVTMNGSATDTFTIGAYSYPLITTGISATAAFCGAIPPGSTFGFSGTVLFASAIFS